MKWEGLWTSGSTYFINDVVSDGSNSYIAKSTHTAGATFSGDLAEYWDLLALGLLPDQTGKTGYILSSNSASAQWINGGLNLTSASVVSASVQSLMASSGSVSFLEVGPGDSSNPPIIFKEATTTTNPVAGAIEYNGISFLTTPNTTSGRAFNDESHLYVQDSDRTLIATVVANTFYSAFGTGIPVESNSSYIVDLLIGMRTGATSHTVSFNFGGTATFSDLQYRTEFTNIAISTGAAGAGTPTAAVTLMFTGNPTTPQNGVISPASTIVSKFFRVHGVVTVGTGGTIIPQIAFSANPTGTNQTTKYSYFKLNAIGRTTGSLNAGNWE
jgi:hypothetical protein